MSYCFDGVIQKGAEAGQRVLRIDKILYLLHAAVYNSVLNHDFSGILIGKKLDLLGLMMHWLLAAEII